ncbi:Hint domain-containing protein [Neokomagataea tanensis]|nr:MULTISPECIES: Hint domain-containing protein [Neokomagataea]
MTTDITGRRANVTASNGNNTVTNFTAGQAGGYLNIRLDGSLSPSTTSVQTINITSANNTRFHIGLTSGFLNGLTNGLMASYTETYNGRVTQIRVSFTGPGFVSGPFGIPVPGLITSTPVVINITGNPFGLRNGHSETRSLNNLFGEVFGGTVDICFLKGALIQTPSADVCVEEIAVGDEVVVYVDGAPKTDTIKWVGKSTCLIRSDVPDDEAGYPVRIMKDAISNGVPSADLLVTAEHCLFFDGKFIPARMLVNGRSIFFDKSFTSYDYYHIETEEHSVIKANGMLTESYLDTGNRSSFRGGKVVYIGQPAKSWENDSAAPLTTAPEAVEPIFKEIEERSKTHSFALVQQPYRLTEDAGVSLLTQSGLTLEPIRQTNGHLVFIIQGDVQSVRILSRASRPYDTIGPYWDDRRSFGVAVSDVHIFEWNEKTSITVHQDVQDLEGWHALDDSNEARWTNGNAFLPLNRKHPEDQAILSLKVQTGTYVLEEENNNASSLSA